MAHAEALLGYYLNLRNHKAPVKDRFVFTPKSGITPVFEVVHFFVYQQPDSFSQLFFEEQSVKTHFCEYSLDIVQHGEHALKK
jgi:hypothetical protein